MDSQGTTIGIEITREELSVEIMNNNTTIDLYAVHPVKDILIATFVTVFVISLAGNLLVVFVIVRNRSMHTVTNFFLLNLALSDLLVTLCCIIPTLMWFIQVSWTLGTFICKVHKASITMTTTASVFMLTVISIERFIAILYPFQTKRILTVQRLIGVVVVIWLLSIIISFPMFMVYELVPYNGNDTYCGPSQDFVENGAITQGLLMIIVCYMTPLLIMMVLYTKISQGLWARSRAGSNPLAASMSADCHSKSSDKSKANVKVTYKGNKAVSSLELAKKNMVPPKEGLRIHIGPQMSPPPLEPSSAFSGNEDTPHKALLCPSSSDTPTRRSNVIEKIGPFYVDEPDENENFTETEEPPSTTVLWKSCNEILPSSTGEKTIPDHDDSIQIKIDTGGHGSNGVGSRMEISRLDNVLNADKNDTSDEQTPCLLHDNKASGNADHSHHLTPSRIHGGVKSRLSSKSEGDKRPIHRKYEPASNSGQASPAYGRGNAHSLSRQCFKKTPSKRKRNAEAVMAARRKVIRLLVVMVVCFAVCLFPLQLMFFLNFFGGFGDTTIAGALGTAFTYLAYFMNSALNPFLYAFLSDNFRSKMRETLYCGSSRARKQASLRKTRLKSMTSDAFTESELMPS